MSFIFFFFLFHSGVTTRGPNRVHSTSKVEKKDLAWVGNHCSSPVLGFFSSFIQRGIALSEVMNTHHVSQGSLQTQGSAAHHDG